MKDDSIYECSEYECKFYTELYGCIDKEWDHDAYCVKHKKYIPEEKLCGEYIKAEKCFNCRFSRSIVYETGSIDCIDYHCKLQNDRMIFSDLSWSIGHYADFPDCNIDEWKMK